MVDDRWLPATMAAMRTNRRSFLMASGVAAVASTRVGDSAEAPQVAEEKRETQVLVEIPPKFCIDPHFSSDTRIGIAIPAGGKVESAELYVSDNDTHGWKPAPIGNVSGYPPNILNIRQDFDDRDGLKFIGWHVENHDENLTRLLHAVFTWQGSGQDIAQSEVMTFHGCHKFPQGRWTRETYVSVGLVLKPGSILNDEDHEVRTSNGPWGHANLHGLTVHNVIVDAPGLPGHKWVKSAATNTDTVAAYAIRVRGRVKT